MNVDLLQAFIDNPKFRYTFRMNEGYAHPSYLNGRVDMVCIYLCNCVVRISNDTISSTTTFYDKMVSTRLYEFSYDK